MAELVREADNLYFPGALEGGDDCNEVNKIIAVELLHLRPALWLRKKMTRMDIKQAVMWRASAQSGVAFPKIFSNIWTCAGVIG